MRFLRPRLVRLAIPLLLGALGQSAGAVGLGSPLQNPVIGQPLRIDIPLLLAPGEALPAPDCVRLAPPADVPDRQFFPRGARAVIDATGRPRVRVIGSEPVNEPLVEFRITVGCGNSFARDYLVLSEHPAALPTVASPPQETAPVRRALPPVPAVDPGAAAPKAAASAPAPSGAMKTLRLTRDTNLNTLARARYPENQATRDEYRRLMARANPDLFAGASRVGSVPLPAGTMLNIPDDLPPPEQEAPPRDERIAERKAPAAPPEPRPAPERSSPAAGGSSAPAGRQDRLVIGSNAGLGAGRGMNPRELANAIDRMERMIEDQGRAELEIMENLKTLNSAFIEMKNYVATLEKQVQQAQAENRRLEAKVDAKPEPKSLGVFELLALILASGAAGAGLIVLHHRLSMQRSGGGENPMMAADPSASPHSGKPAPEALLPWATDASTPAPVAPAVPAARPTPPSPNPTPVAKAAPPSQPPRPVPPPAAPPKPAAAATTVAAAKPTPTVAAAPPDPTRPAPPPVSPTTPPPVAPAVTTPPASSDPEASGLASVLDRPNTRSPAEDAPLEFEFTLPELPPAGPGELPALPELDAGSPELPALSLAPVDASDGGLPESLGIELELPASPAPTIPPAPTGSGHQAVELADIMASMGLGKEAARTLVEHILADPRRDLAPWLKAFEIYRKTGQREEFEWLAENLRKHLNVAPLQWEQDSDDHQRSLIEFRHLAKELVNLWPTAECMAFLDKLLLDNRDGVRQGFPASVAEEIVLLQRILRDYDTNA